MDKLPYVYVWTDWEKGMYYIGSHNGKDDKYIGSGVDFKKAYKDREWAFTQERIYTETVSQARRLEAKMLSDVNADLNVNYYNRSILSSGVNKHSKETREKMSLSHKGMVFSDEHRKNISRSAKKRGVEGMVSKRRITVSVDGVVFKSITAAAKHLNLSRQYVNDIVNGKENNIYNIKRI